MLGIPLRMALCAAIALGLSCSGDGPPYFIPGTATLPACDAAPAFDLSDTVWSSEGNVTIDTTGCDDAQPGEELESCPLTWEMTQTGSDVSILVDNEYEILGRLCGDQLSLEGGFWLPVRDDGDCTYEEDSAAEVGIQAGGSTLTVVDDPQLGPELAATGALALGGPCEATYDLALIEFTPSPSLP